METDFFVFYYALRNDHSTSQEHSQEIRKWKLEKVWREERNKSENVTKHENVKTDNFMLIIRSPLVFGTQENEQAYKRTNELFLAISNKIKPLLFSQ